MQEQKSFGRSIFILLFSILGCFLLVSLYMPKVIDWYATPYLMPQGFSCGPTIQWAIGRMLWFQLASVILGTIFGLLVIFKIRKKT